MRIVRTGAVLAAASLTLTACSTGPAGEEKPSEGASGSSSQSSGSEGGDAAFPVTVKHALGETTIEQQPTKVATLGWSDHDVVAALGVVPTGAPQITWGGNAKKSTDWFDKKVNELDPKAEITRYSDADGAPVDEIVKLQPDVILATNSGVTPEEYEKLSKIAPVVAYPEVTWGTSWQDSTKMTGQALGKSDEAEKVIADTEKQVEETAAKYPALKGATVAWASFSPTDLSTFALYTTTDNRPRMLEELGMVNAPLIGELSKDEKTFQVDVSAEKARTVDADVVVFYADEAGTEKAVTGNKQWPPSRPSSAARTWQPPTRWPPSRCPAPPR